MKEVRSFSESDLVLDVRDDGVGELTGYAAVFNARSVEMGFIEKFTESIRPGAFSRTLAANPDVRALLDHDTGQIIGRTKNNSLRLVEDERGLRVSIRSVPTRDNEKAFEWVRSGLVDAMSFGFEVVTDSWTTRDGKPHRELIEVDLYEVSLVAFPAYPATTIGVRSVHDVWSTVEQRRAQRKMKSAKRRCRVASL